MNTKIYNAPGSNNGMCITKQKDQKSTIINNNRKFMWNCVQNVLKWGAGSLCVDGCKVRWVKIIMNILEIFTNKSFWTTAIVLGNTINACTTIFTRRRPTFIPICLTLYSRISIYAITRICTGKLEKEKIINQQCQK